MVQVTFEDLEETLGHRFREPQWLSRALTHRSLVTSSGKLKDNERLEFLGDSILGFIVSERLCRECPELAEGELSRARSQLVSSFHLAHVGEMLSIGKFLFLGRGEEKNGGRTKPALLVNAVEALIAALYRDGGFEAAERFVIKFVLPQNLPTVVHRLITSDHKSILQEMLQASHQAAPVYQILSEKGPEHQKVFTVEVRTLDGFRARGRGLNKKAAEQNAAKVLVQKFTKEQ